MYARGQLSDWMECRCISCVLAGDIAHDDGEREARVFIGFDTTAIHFYSPTIGSVSHFTMFYIFVRHAELLRLYRCVAIMP